jgi:hypothetical protein
LLREEELVDFSALLPRPDDAEPADDFFAAGRGRLGDDSLDSAFFAAGGRGADPLAGAFFVAGRGRLGVAVGAGFFAGLLAAEPDVDCSEPCSFESEGSSITLPS